MKKFYMIAALLMASTAAHAGNSISFEFQGHKIHIEAPKNCDQLSCLQISAPDLSGSNLDFKDLKSTFNHHDDDDVATPADQPAQKAATAPAVPVVAPQPSVAAAPSAPQPPTVVASTPPTAPAQLDVAPAASPAPAAVAPEPAPVAATPVAALTSPLGVWATEENKGNVRIEQCGQNLCGFATKTGEKILINMKPTDKKWTGQIHDPDSGRNYDSTIAMKGPNALRVQGCAFGGMFCGGQTWNRVS
jgi:uncharacterized protein (DUF2147 family)